MNEGEEVCKHHQFLRYPSTHLIASYFAQHSSFKPWLRVKKPPGDGNPQINACFNKKSKDIKVHDEKVGKRFNSSLEGVASLFNRFLRYACDIDNGLGYVNDARLCAEQNGSFTFLDLGFAPGGMVSLLLDCHPKTRGIGVNLSPERGGNVYPEVLDNIRDEMGNLRFKALEEDVIELARSEKNLLTIFEDLIIDEGFDLVIVGITTSGSYQKTEGRMDELELKNLLHFAQLFLAFKFLKPNGRILMRMHLGLRLVDIHMLTLLLQHFPQNLMPAKPLTEFAMRKTFWVYGKGFNNYDKNALGRLKELIQPCNAPPYGESEKVGTDGETLCNNPILIELEVKVILEKYGQDLIKILAPMWNAQYDVLNAIMNGCCERVCYSCRSGWFCHKCRKNVPRQILNAVRSVQQRLDTTAHLVMAEKRK
jgi:hypothetical protein